MAEIFLSNIPTQWNQDELQRFVRPYLKVLEIHVFWCSKPKSKTFGFLCLATQDHCQKLLDAHENSTFRVRRPLHCPKGFVKLQKSHKDPDPLQVKSLLHQEETRQKRLVIDRQDTLARRAVSRRFEVTSLQCGLWGVEGDDGMVRFLTQYNHPGEGEVIFGRSSLALLLHSTGYKHTSHRLNVNYLSIDNIAVGPITDPYITLTLGMAPTITESMKQHASAIFPQDLYSSLWNFSDIFQSLSHTSLADSSDQQNQRVTSLGPGHRACVSGCYVYRLSLRHPQSVELIYNLLESTRGMPSIARWSGLSTPVEWPSFQAELKQLQHVLGMPQGFGNLPFMLKFQIEKLAVNGYLRPKLVEQLLPTVARLHSELGTNATTLAVRNLSTELPSFGPYTEPKWFTVQYLSELLEESATSYRETGSIYDIDRKHSHVALIHRVTVTPTGYYFDGPFLETKNRVLRRYEDKLNYFLRLTFADENGEQLRWSSQHSLDGIYTRFRFVMNDAIKIAGHRFQFLGFSHSSLRNQTCWFMAPFVDNQELVHAREVIGRLGDFSTIRSPAKCAARIGQAFSDTTGSVIIEKEALQVVPDIERNGRVFSDGVGTISQKLLNHVWSDYSMNQAHKPTILQIRFMGAKGVISLDTRKAGEKLSLRPSMIKFHARGELQLEICGSNNRTLPLYLNRSLIKILEDLGVEANVFMDLQRSAMDKLEHMSMSAMSAANYLEANRMCTSQRLPSLLRLMNDIDLDFRSDWFLRDTIEIAALAKVREMKYRARIPVEEGLTLYGIMDETGVLKEGQIYCVVELESGGRQVLIHKKAAITRSPALHPGDVQLVECVDVPKDSPLNALRNCIVFSQQGARDLPSQLSGGDLDGDYYNVIYDPRLVPERTVEPADYPRARAVDIGREVTEKDMTDFFIEFMKSDQLGRICNMHLQLADRYPAGTEHPDCRLLAELASVAVDFSKTGVPVDPSRFPAVKCSRVRPDFMALTPRVHITAGKGVLLEHDENDFMDEERDAILELDPNFSQYQYYKSEKVLGQLYRAIDEQKFLEHMEAKANESASKIESQKNGVMAALLDHILYEAYGFEWEPYIEKAWEIRNSYENTLMETMTAFALHPSYPLTELEVFSGSILGMAGGALNKHTRELAKEMKKDFDQNVTYYRELIRGDYDPLPRAMACLHVGLEEGKTFKGRKLESFKYVAAEVCMRELSKLPGLGRLVRKI